ncbi:MAG: hypothetical protein NC131_21310, partial [Roseburia sp.]|nr:hypothetical protein [Roseburia sp.]
EAEQIVIPLPADYRSKYRRLVMYAVLRGPQSPAALDLADPPRENSVMVTGGYFASSSYGSLYVAADDDSGSGSFNRVVFDLSAPRACTHVCRVYCYTGSSSSDIRSTGYTDFYAARTLTWSQVTQIKLSCKKPLLAGSSVTLYGVR